MFHQKKVKSFWLRTRFDSLLPALSLTSELISLLLTEVSKHVPLWNCTGKDPVDGSALSSWIRSAGRVYIIDFVS